MTWTTIQSPSDIVEITIDIESVPCQWPGILDEYRAAVQAPATNKKPESIAAWLEEHREAEAEAAWLKTSFDGGMGQICVIGWAIDDEPAEALQVADLTPDAEAELLRYWFDQLRQAYSGTHHQRPIIIGHNHVSFDLPFIWQRAIVHGIKPPMWLPRDPKPWSESVFDTMTQWAGVKSRISMDRLCRVLGIPGKDGMTGADVWPAVKAGRIDEVAAYCKKDVERTRAIHKRLTFSEQP